MTDRYTITESDLFKRCAPRSNIYFLCDGVYELGDITYRSHEGWIDQAGNTGMARECRHPQGCRANAKPKCRCAIKPDYRDRPKVGRWRVLRKKRVRTRAYKRVQFLSVKYEDYLRHWELEGPR